MGITHYYEVSLKWDDERKGTLRSEVLTDTITVATPPEFPKGIPDIWSPEHLFVAAISSCLMTTFLAIAEHSKLAFKSFDCKAEGKLETVEGRYLITEVTLWPVVEIFNAEDEEKALKILNKSEAVCLISNSIKSTIVFNPQIIIVN